MSSRASINEPKNWSSASAESGFPATIFLTRDRLSLDDALASDRECTPRAAISAAPSARCGPVSKRIKDAPASGFPIMESIATISATSGTWTRPPSPTTSHSISALRSALCSAGICARLRTKIAKVFGALLASTRRCGSFHNGAMYSAIAAASASIVSKRPTARSPLPAPGRGVSGETLRFPSDRT